jgi:hypothetical protein
VLTKLSIRFTNQHIHIPIPKYLFVSLLFSYQLSAAIVLSPPHTEKDTAIHFALCGS